jgi:Zn-dependent alcohol dehydrogenase
MKHARAAVLDAPGAPLRLATVEVGAPGPGEVLVRVDACGVCRSDRHVQMTGETVTLPAVLGHEAAGVVEEVGDQVEALDPGDHVVLAWTPSCGRCRFCRRGAPNLCVDLVVSPRGGRLGEEGTPLGRYMNVAGFTERTVVGAAQAVKVRRDVDLERVCLLGCGVMTGFGAAVRAGDVRAGQAVVVFGCGAVGLSAIQGAAMAGADPLIAVDMSDEKLAIASRMGATQAVNVRGTDPVAAIGTLTAGVGADVVIEAVGDTEVLTQAMAATSPGGRTVTVGLTDLEAEVRLSPFWLLLDRTLRGSIYGSANPQLDFPRMADWYAAGRLDLDGLVTETFPLERVNEALDALDGGEAIRSVIRVQP